MSVSICTKSSLSCLVFLCPVLYVSLNGTDGAIGMQHLQGIITGSDGLLGNSARLLLVQISLVQVRFVLPVASGLPLVL